VGPRVRIRLPPAVSQTNFGTWVIEGQGAGTEGSKPASSSSESANFRLRCRHDASVAGAHPCGVQFLNCEQLVVARLNPSFARGWYISGGLRLLAGQLDIAIEHA
jgi:hypothetical protein